jgi:hypothetical protein
MAPQRGHFLVQNFAGLLMGSELGRLGIEHKAAIDMADDNGDSHEHHRGGHAAEDKAEKP